MLNYVALIEFSFFFRVPQVLLGWKLSALMVTHITTTLKLEVPDVPVIIDMLCCFTGLVILFGPPHLSESIWEKPADFPSNEASGSSKKENLEEPTAPEPEPLSAGEESSNGASQEEKVPEQSDQEPKVPKINFRVRPGSE